MKIKIYGPSCPKCIATERNVVRALEELEKEGKLKEGEEIKVSSVKDLEKMLALGIFFTPALVIDGTKLTEGRIPEVKEIKKLIEGRLTEK